MSGKRQPTDVILANGKKHLSREEENRRRDAEVNVEHPQTVTPPKYLPKKHRTEFAEIGEILLRSNLYTELDRDCLAQYFICRERWDAADRKAKKAISERNSKEAQAWTSVQGTYFKQAQRCATELGLTISSRCKLVVPAAMQDSTDEGTDEFTAMLEARKRAAGGM